MSELFRLTPPRLSENDVEEQIKNFLERRGWRLIRNHVGKFVPLRVVFAIADAVAALVQSESTESEEYRHASEKAWRRNVVAIGEKGITDWLAVHPYFPSIWIEVKAPGEKPTVEQLDWINRKLAEHYLAGWWDDLEKFAHWYGSTVNRRTA